MEVCTVFHARGIALLAFGLLVLAVTAPAGVQQEFNLTYARYPLDAAGAIDRDQAPMRFWYKGNRSRTDILMMQDGQSQLIQSSILDCDSSRTITIQWPQRTYTLETFEEYKRKQEQALREAGRASQVGMPGGRPSAGTTGGTVTISTVWRDSMLDEQRFGFPVRWASMVLESDASENACYPQDMRMESHYWVVDLDLPLCNPPVVADGGVAASGPADGGCRDRVEQKTVGKPPPLDFILRQWMVGEDGRITGFEVVDLSREELADSLFVPPAGFRQVDPGAAYAAGLEPGLAGPGAAPPKAPGAIRVAVAVKLPPGAPAAPVQLASDVAEWIRGQGLDAVPLNATDRQAALAEAPGVEADYVLYYDLEKAEAKVSGRGMLGAALGGAIGERAAGGALQLEVEGGYELLTPAGERVTDGEIDDKERAEDPQAQLASVLKAAAEPAIAAIPR
jgi:hypothetical protein